MIDTLFFDLDDTLVAYEAVSEISWRQAVTDYLPGSDQAQNDAIYQVIREYSHWFWGDEERNRIYRQNIREARRKIVAMAFKELGFPEEEANRVADTFSRVRIENMHLLPNTIETLTYFRERGYKMALLTNGNPPEQRGKIARFDLERFFDKIYIEGELGFGKPDPRVFRMALEQLQSEPEHTLMIGDNLVWDIQGAEAVGIKAVWYNWKGIAFPKDAGVQPVAIIINLKQLIDAVEL